MKCAVPREAERTKYVRARATQRTSSAMLPPHYAIRRVDEAVRCSTAGSEEAFHSDSDLAKLKQPQRARRDAASPAPRGSCPSQEQRLPLRTCAVAQPRCCCYRPAQSRAPLTGARRVLTTTTTATLLPLFRYEHGRGRGGALLLHASAARHPAERGIPTHT